jgi:peptidoglycan/LPS O-acetylase OafA/YrhL
LGDASYSIYLFHLLCTALLGKFVVRVGLTGLSQLLAMIVLSLLMSSVAGLVIHYGLERRMLRVLRRQRRLVPQNV